MNIIQPIRKIMTTNLLTVHPEDALEVVKNIFAKDEFHHLPVIKGGKIAGIVSKSDYLNFSHGFRKNDGDRFIEQNRLQRWKVKDIMTKQIVTVPVGERLDYVVELFLQNRFHAVPVMDGDKLVGIITTHDILKLVRAEPVTLQDYESAK